MKLLCYRKDLKNDDNFPKYPFIQHLRNCACRHIKSACRHMATGLGNAVLKAKMHILKFFFTLIKHKLSPNIAKP